MAGKKAWMFALMGLAAWVIFWGSLILRYQDLKTPVNYRIASQVKPGEELRVGNGDPKTNYYLPKWQDPKGLFLATSEKELSDGIINESVNQSAYFAQIANGSLIEVPPFSIVHALSTENNDNNLQVDYKGKQLWAWTGHLWRKQSP